MKATVGLAAAAMAVCLFALPAQAQFCTGGGGEKFTLPHQHLARTEHGLQVAETDLSVADARYLVEGHYITPDDAAAGNGLNNTSYREVAVSRDENGNWRFANLDFTIRGKSAIEAWTAEGATLRYIDEGIGDGTGAFKTRVIVGYRAYGSQERSRHN